MYAIAALLSGNVHFNSHVVRLLMRHADLFRSEVALLIAIERSVCISRASNGIAGEDIQNIYPDSALYGEFCASSNIARNGELAFVIHVPLVGPIMQLSEIRPRSFQLTWVQIVYHRRA